jgi:lysophospholipase L1-like esterase
MMRIHDCRRTVCIAAALAISASALLAQGAFYLKDGDRVVFYGDSITDQRLYTTFAETYVVTRFPGMKVSFVHSGWGGDRVTGGGGGPIDTRLPRDVFAYKPTVMTIMLGMNDGEYRAFDQQVFDTYANGYRHIVDSVRAALPGIRITVLQPSPYDDVTREPRFPGGYNAVLLRFSHFLKDLAQEDRLALADLNTPVVAALARAKAADPEMAQRILPDRVHPGAAGHLLMAEALLKAWNAPPVVTSVEIDAAAKDVRRAENTHIAGLETGPVISWTQTDGALPMPLNGRDPLVELVLRSSDFVEALDQQPLRVTGLTAARYILKIDGETVGAFTGRELAGGINLATLPTPMAKQAAEVHALTLRHNDIHFARWRTLQVPLEKDAPARLAAAMESLDALEADVVALERTAAQPKPHRYELAPE